MRKFFNSKIKRKAYLGKSSRDFSQLVALQASAVYKAQGLIFPVAASSTLSYIKENEPVSMADIATGLERPHQSVAQKIASLVKLGLIEKRQDMNDRRRLEFSLSPIGRDQAQRLEECMVDVAAIYDEMFKEIGIDLTSAIESAQAALRAKPLIERFSLTLYSQK